MSVAAPEIPVTYVDMWDKERVNMLLLAAFHEICHCMVAEVSGLRTSDIWIKRSLFSNGCSGATEIDLANTPGVYIDPDEPTMYHVEEEHTHAFLLCCVAGWRGVAHWYRTVQIGEEAILGVAPDWGAGSDMKAFNCVRRETGLSKQRAVAEADRLIKRYWPQITAGVGRLYVRKRLDAAKVVSADMRARAAAQITPRTPRPVAAVS